MDEFKDFIREGDEPVYEFMQQCEEMTNVKFILAERKISEMLITVATSKKLSEMVANCSHNYDFYGALAAAKVRIGKRYSLVPPVSIRDQVAFAINLLYSFDVRAIPLQNFLQTFFYSRNGINFSFLTFVRTIIIPLKENIKRLLDGNLHAEDYDTSRKGKEIEDDEEDYGVDANSRYARIFKEDDKSVAKSDVERSSDYEVNDNNARGRAATPPPEPQPEPKPFYTEADFQMKDSAVNDIVERLTDICDIADEQIQVSHDELKELYEICGGLATGVKRKDKTMVKTSITGLTATVRASGLENVLGEKISELQETLKHFGVL